MTKKHILSKSTFLHCHKSLYLNRCRRDLRDLISQEQQAVIATGREVGELAIGLVPFGAEIIRSKMLSRGIALPMPRPLWTNSGLVLVTEGNTAPNYFHEKAWNVKGRPLFLIFLSLHA